jgi:SAM-dependent methyltransferase
MEDYMEVNQERWNELVDAHIKSDFYNLEGFKRGTKSLHDLELQELAGDVAGKTLLHLQCHFGMDTLAWARLGAKVTGVDFSDQAIAQAQALSKELDIDATFVCSNVYDLPQALSGQFDIVYTSYGVLSWLPDLQRWGQVIAYFLKPGGIFYIAENHPFIHIFDDSSPSLNFKIAYPYFLSGPLKFEVQGSYATSSTELVHTTEYCWNHSLSEIITSLILAGLKIEYLHEFPFCEFACFPEMEEGEDHMFRFKDERLRNMLPLTFSIKAAKE